MAQFRPSPTQSARHRARGSRRPGRGRIVAHFWTITLPLLRPAITFSTGMAVSFDPSVVSVIGSGIIGSAQHPNAAHVLQNWLLSPAEQSAITARGDYPSPSPPGTFGDAAPESSSLPANAAVVDSLTTPEQVEW